MKFQDILESNISQEEHIIEMYHNIYQNCQPFLQEIDKRPADNPLYRGIKYLGAGHVYDAEELDVGIKTARLGSRKPIDMPNEDHEALNKYLTIEYGHPYRSAVFATGSDHVAVNYGDQDEPFVIFPVGKFEFIWHREIGDFYGEFYDSPVYQDLSGGPNGDPDYQPMELDDMIAHLFDEYYEPFQTGDMISAIQSDHEIMIWVDKYYYMKPEFVRGFQEWLSK